MKSKVYYEYFELYYPCIETFQYYLQESKSKKKKGKKAMAVSTPIFFKKQFERLRLKQSEKLKAKNLST